MANASHTSSSDTLLSEHHGRRGKVLCASMVGREQGTHNYPDASSESLRDAHTVGVASHKEHIMLHRDTCGIASDADPDCRVLYARSTRRTRRPKNMRCPAGAMHRIFDAVRHSFRCPVFSRFCDAGRRARMQQAGAPATPKQTFCSVTVGSKALILAPKSRA